MTLKHTISLFIAMAMISSFIASTSQAAKQNKSSKRSKVQSLDFTTTTKTKKNKTAVDSSLERALYDEENAKGSTSYYASNDDFEITESYEEKLESEEALAQQPQTTKPLQKLNLNTAPAPTLSGPNLKSPVSATKEPSTQSSTKLSASVPLKTKRFGVYASVSQSNSLVNREDGSQQSSIDVTVIPSFKIFDRLTLKARLDATQDLVNQENSEVTNASGSITYSGMSFLKGMDNSLILSGGLPVTKAHEAQSFLFSTTGTLTASINQKEFNLDRFTGTAYLSIGRNFHTYEDEIGGRINTLYYSKQGLEVGYTLTKKLTITAGLEHSSGISYLNEIRESFAITESLTYAINETYSANLSHSNSGTALKADGRTSNVEFLNEDSSVVSAGLEVSF